MSLLEREHLAPCAERAAELGRENRLAEDTAARRQREDEALRLNDLDLYDVRLEKGASVTLPHRPGWARYFFVYSGSVEAERTRFDQAESGLITDFAELVLRAIEPLRT